MAKKEEITFEVLILSGSHWEAQGVYGAQEQGLAVGDAKSLERVSTIKAVKVVKEYYDKKTQSSRSLNVYESKPLNAPKASAQTLREQPRVPVKKGRLAVKTSRSSKPGSTKTPSSQKSRSKKSGSRKSGGGSLSDAMIDAPPPLAEVSQRPPLFGVFFKVMISLVLAIVAAMAVTELVSLSLPQTQVIGFMKRDDFLIAIFILVFAIMSLALIARILSNLKPMASRPSRSVKPQRRATPRLENTMRRNSEIEVARLDELEALNKVIAEAEAQDKVREEEEEDARQKVQEETQRAQQEEDAMCSETIAMQAFTHDVLSVVQDDLENHDAHMVFGLVLFLVGAVQALRHQKNIDEDTFKKIATRSLGELGLSQERAERFIENTDEYLVSNSRYSQMFQSGRTAMTAHLENDVGPQGLLVEVMSEWDKPTPNVEKNQPVTVLFTDIVGSTALTQKLGDEGAQEIVRAHNTIVREAIHVFTGKEIKHTGDGIMASFASAASGVEAACDIQRKVMVHSAMHLDRPLALKIGLNAGEPISEDDDLFGSTVQLAARIVDAADAGCILVSSSVHGLCQGKNLPFEKFGDLEMKGFDEPVPVYTVVWEPQPEPQRVSEPQLQPGPQPEIKAPQAKNEPQAETQPSNSDARATKDKGKGKDRPQND